MGLLNLFDPRTGRPVAIIDAAGLTDMRTGAVTAIGAKYLARQVRAACSATSARAARPTGTCACSTGCSTSTRSASIRAGRKAATRSPQRLARDLGKPVVATDDWESCVRGADIVVEASRLDAPEPMLQDRVDRARRVRRSLRHDERGRAFAHRHHGQDRRRRLGPVPERRSSAACARTSTPASCPRRRCTPSWARSSPAASPAARATTRRSCSGIAGCRLSDIALGAAMLAKAKRLGIGQTLRYA